MQKKLHNVLFGISVLPVLLVLPALGDVRITVGSDIDFDDGFTLTGVSAAANGGAMIVRDFSTATFNGTASFENNTAVFDGDNTGLGGAIFINNNEGGSSPILNGINFMGVTTFSGNTANGGGALYSEGVVVFYDIATFTGNQTTDAANSTGAGIGANALSDITFKKSVLFENNGTNGGTYGGAGIANSGTIVFEDTATFTGNVATGSGSAFANGGTMIFQKGLTVTANRDTVDPDAVGGANTGAVSNGGFLSVYGGDINISSNVAGGKAGVQNNGELLFGAYKDGDDIIIAPVANITFKNNMATAGNAGALFVHEASTTTQMYADNILFENNDSAGSYGGAIWTDDELIIKGASIVFKDNDANGTTDVVADLYKYGGGAIQHRGYTQGASNLTIGLDDGSSEILFQHNTSMTNGGALHIRVKGANESANTTINGNTTFTENHADLNGGAIYHYVGAGTSVLSLSDGTVFDNNTAGEFGGAIYNTGFISIADGSSFSENGAKNGGAIYNIGDLEIGDGVTFDSNTASVTETEPSTQMGAAIYSEGTDTEVRTLTIGDNVEFTNNVSDSGAVFLYGANNVEFGDNVLFSGNSAHEGAGLKLANSGDNGVNVVTIGNGAQFLNNTVTGWGGAAIEINGIGNSLELGMGTVVSNNHGNAIYNAGTLTFGSGATFTGNIATYTATLTEPEYNQAGAIWNRGTLNLNGASFTGNSAISSSSNTFAGGAIYNSGVATLGGINVFSGNVANGVANDIWNDGTLNIASGTTTVDGGIDGVGNLIVASGAVLNIGTTTLTQGTVALDGTIIALLDSVDSFAQLNVGAFSGGGTLALTLRTEGTYALFGDDALAQRLVEFSADGIDLNSPVYNITWSDDGKSITASRKTAEEIAMDNGLSGDAGQTVAGLMNSSSDELNDLALVAQEQLAMGNSDAVEHAHAALNPETESVVQSVTTSVQNTVANLASGRMALNAMGRNGGDVVLTTGGIWAQGIYNKSKQNDAFNGYTRGVAFGVDGTLNNVWTLGAGYSYAHSDVAARARNTEIDSLTVFAYSQYKPSDWYLNVLANYTMSDYSEVGDVLGTTVKSDYDVNAIGGQVMTGYNFAGGITPQVGLRYIHISTDDYKNSLGIVNRVDDADYLTVVLETKYAYGFRVSKRMMLRPELHYALKYDVLSDDHIMNVVMPGAGGYTLNGQRLSRIGTELGAGLGVKYNGLDLSLHYDIDIREGYTSQTGRVKFRYNF